MPTTTPGIACMHQWRRVDGAEVMIYALGLAMSGNNPTMPPRNSSELASDSVLSKMLAASACMVCRGGGVRRGGWKAWQSASKQSECRPRRGIVVAATACWQHPQQDLMPSQSLKWFCVAEI